MNDKTPAAGAAPQENKMGVQPIGRLLASMAIPMMLSMLVQALYNVVDSVFVSRISENALNAVSLAFPLQNLMIAVGAGTAVGINALLSRSLGEKKQEMADRAAGTGIFLSLCNAVAFALIGIFLSRAFFMSQAKSVPEIVEMGTAYTRICLGLSVGLFCQFCFERLLQSTGRTVLAMATQMIGAVINIVLDPVFIFGLCGMPRLEVTGPAVATVLGQFVGALLAVLLNLKRYPGPPRGKGDLPGGRPLYRHAVHRFRDDLRHEQDPVRVHAHRHRRVRRVFQNSELHLHAGIRPEQRHAPHHLLQLRRRPDGPGKADREADDLHRRMHHDRGLCRLPAGPGDPAGPV